MDSGEPPPPKRLALDVPPPPPTLTSNDDNHDSDIPLVDQRTTDLCRLVFDIELLREKILEYAILDKNGRHPSPALATSCRLVQMSWLESITKLYYKNKFKLPLFYFRIGQPQHQDNPQSRTTFHQFVDAYATTHPLIPRVPPFFLDVHLNSPDMYTPETRERFEKCMHQCSTGLVYLSLNIGTACENLLFPPDPTNLSLPSLLTFEIEVHTDSHLTPNANYRSYAIRLIQAILTGATQLRSLTLKGTPSLETLLPGFQHLRLPTSLVELGTYRGVAPIVLEGFSRANALPELRYLTIFVARDFHDYINDSLYNIANQLRSTLTELNIADGDMDVRPARNVLRLPIMEKLTSFSLFCRNYEWPEGTFKLETIFPKLNKLQLYCQPASLLRRWMWRSCFGSVKVLFISLPALDLETFMSPKLLTLELVTLMHRAFPNLTELIMMVANTEDVAPAIQYIFRNMRKLEELFLSLRNAEGQVVRPLFWDSLLVGVPMEIMGGLGASHCVDDAYNRVDRGLIQPSITNLTKLNTFYLRDTLKNGEEPTPISDAVFQLAFLKMANLQDLSIGGKFKVSAEMKAKWTESDTGRKLSE